MNKDFLQHDYYTDIISFDYSVENRIAGEFYISVDRVSENANDLSISQIDEMHRVMIHGVLHVCGYKDKTQAQAAQMRKAEDRSLALRSTELMAL